MKIYHASRYCQATARSAIIDVRKGADTISGLRANDLSEAIQNRADDIWRLCFVALRDPDAASAAAFQAFLYYGERCGGGDDADLFDWAETAIRDQRLRRGTRPRSDAVLARRGFAPPPRVRGEAEARRAIEIGEGELARLISSIDPPDDWARTLDERVFVRFSERSVAFENRLLRIRSAADRAVPWIALAIAALSAAAAWYTSAVE